MAGGISMTRDCGLLSLIAMGAMENHLFTARQLAVLTRPERWRFVATGFPAEAAAPRRCAHDAWVRAHVDMHPHRELLFVLSGGGYYGLCGRSYPTRPGTAMLFDAMEPHDLSYPSNRPPAEHLWFYFSRGQCGVGLTRVGVPGARMGCRNVWKRSFLLAELGVSTVEAVFPDRNSGVPPEDRRRRCAAALGLLTASLIDRGYRPQPTARAAGAQAEVIGTIVRHIREHRGQGCHLDDLARIAGYSKYHFLRLFREYAGMPVHECVAEARAQAYRELAATGAPVKVLAHRLGFAHSSALCRWRRRRGL